MRRRVMLTSKPSRLAEVGAPLVCGSTGPGQALFVLLLRSKRGPAAAQGMFCFCELMRQRQARCVAFAIRSGPEPQTGAETHGLVI